MPLFDYVCKTCDAEAEVLETIRDGKQSFLLLTDDDKTDIEILGNKLHCKKCKSHDIMRKPSHIARHLSWSQWRALH